MKLEQISGEYEATGRADGRLTEEAEGGRGFGGIGILWHRRIGATPVGGISSAISVGLGSLDCNKEHLVELERVVSESELLGPVIVLGDFNAHLGGYVGPGEPNVQKVLLQEVMERLHLSTVSLGNLASGPGNTYWSGDVWTIVYYVWMLKLCH